MAWRKPIIYNKKHVLICGVPIILLVLWVVFTGTFMYFFPDENVELWFMRAGMISLGFLVFTSFFGFIIVSLGLKKWFNK